MGSATLPAWLSETGVSADIGDIVGYIHHLRADLSTFYPAGQGETGLSSARAELGQVVVASEGAANTIMDACDALGQALRDGTAIGKARATEALNSIYEACSFQDLTSQRVVKVEKTLSVIEQKLTALALKLGVDVTAIDDVPSAVSVDDDASLMNGPAMPGAGVDQSDVDKFFG